MRRQLENYYKKYKEMNEIKVEKERSRGKLKKIH